MGQLLEVLHGHVDADPLRARREHLGGGDVPGPVRERVEHELGRLAGCSGEPPLRPRYVAGQGIDGLVPPERGCQQLVIGVPAQVAERLAERAPVQRVVDRLLERDLPGPLERRPIVVEGEVPHVEPWAHEEAPARPVDAVLGRQAAIRSLGDPELDAEVDPVLLGGG